MRENLERSRGVVFSGTVLLELARRGVSREQAYEWVQRNAMRSFHEQRDFKALLLADADVTRGAAAGRDRAGVRSRRAAAARRRHLRPRVRAGRAGGDRLSALAEEQSMRARVFVTLKPSVFDPQGRTIADALHSLGYGDVEDVRQGKYFELELDDDRRRRRRRRWRPKSPTSCWPIR